MSLRPDTQQILGDQGRSQLFTVKVEHFRIIEAGVSSDLLSHSGRQAIEWPAGSVIEGKYRIDGILGQGGMGTVYKALHLQLDKIIALKTLRSAQYSEDAWQRFQKEAKILASLENNNVIRVYDFGFAQDGSPYYAMEYLQGEPLDQKLAAQGSLLLKTAIDIFIQVCHGLEAAHKKGILHRDIKPANIFLEEIRSSNQSSSPRESPPRYHVKLLDFGIASLSIDGINQAVSTETGGCFGSPLYMSPEQATGGKLTAATDIYSCGCALFQVLTGSPPFLGETAFATLVKHQDEKPKAVSDSFPSHVIPARLDKLVAKMLAKDPAQRFNSIGEVAVELEAIVKTSLPGLERTRSLARDEPLPIATARAKSISKWTYVFAAAVLMLAGVLIIVARPWDQAKVTAAATRTAMSELPSGIQVNKQLRKESPAEAPKRYLASTAEDQKNGMRRFCFPEKRSLGRLESYDSPRGGVRPAQSTVLVPQSWTLELIAGVEVAKDPTLFDGFGPDDLTVLRLDNISSQEIFSDIVWSGAQMPHVAKLTGLRRFECNEAEIDPAFISALNKLTRLESAQFLGVKRDASVFLKLERLPALSELRMSQADNAGVIVDKLASSQSKIVKLNLNYSDLTDDDMKNIAKLKKLNYLDIAGNKKVGDKGLEAICSNHELVTLLIDHTKISKNCVAKLIKLPKLAFVSLDKTLLSPQELNKLQSHFGSRLEIRLSNLDWSKKLSL